MCAQHSDPEKSYRLQLLREMRSGIYADQKRLPRESVLCEKMGISRTQLRDILAALEREGFITRRHGVGTVINHHVLAVKNRVDMASEFLDIIRQSGYEPGTAWVTEQDEEADEKIASKLQVPLHSPMLRISRLCTADGRPAIYCEDIFPKEMIHGSYTEEEMDRPIYTFLPQISGKSAYMDLTRIRAVAADETVAQALEIPIGTPVLNLEEIDYDIEGHPIFCSHEYFVDEMFEQVILRKKL